MVVPNRPYLINNVHTLAFIQGSRAASQEEVRGVTEVSSFLTITQVSSGLKKLATLHLDTSVNCALRYWLAALQLIPCIHSVFHGNGTPL